MCSISYTLLLRPDIDNTVWMHAGLALQRMGYLCVVTGVRVRCAISNAICRKAFAMAHIHAEDAADDLMKVYNGLQVSNLPRESCSLPLYSTVTVYVLAVIVYDWFWSSSCSINITAQGHQACGLVGLPCFTQHRA
jgi:hypothetical protein